MKGDSGLLKIIFDIITVVVLILIIVFVVEAIINSQYAKDIEYSKYTYILSQIINNEGSTAFTTSLYIPNYDYDYVPVIIVRKNNEFYLDMYKCYYKVAGSNPKVSLWNVSTFPVDSNYVYLFSPDLSECSLLQEEPISGNSINVVISSLGGSAGYPSVFSYCFKSSEKPPSPFVEMHLGLVIYGSYQVCDQEIYVLNETTITCNDNGCYLNYNGNNYPLQCYLNFSNDNIIGCAELVGFLVPEQIEENTYGYNILQQMILGNETQNITYYLLKLEEFIDNPILLVENEKGITYFYYELTPPK